MDLAALKTELTADPLARGYAGMGDEAAARTFAIADRQTNRDSISGGMLVASIVRSEFALLLAGDKQYVQLAVAANDIPLTATFRAELGAVFGAGTATRANFIALLKRVGNRAEELGLGGIPTTSDVANARRI